ncbi:MAG: NrsF family protein, partial [Roseateles sp.]|uniref:NrsF family protein n=1 Tax=Roseateles sp. TaxID=1971397 RepID=UPI004035F240
LLRAARGLPVVNPRRAGAAAGLLAGCTATAGYALACTETSAAFVAVWYSCGLLASMALGAWLGPRWLRW